MDSNEDRASETCHSERSEESSSANAIAHHHGFFAALRMTGFVDSNIF
jgi:hypothetical protein